MYYYYFINYGTFPSRRDSSVGIVTSYGLYGPGFEFRQGQVIFKDGPDRHCLSSSLLFSGYRGSNPEVAAAE
jgi:hypothetical protein